MVQATLSGRNEKARERARLDAVFREGVLYTMFSTNGFLATAVNALRLTLLWG